MHIRNSIGEAREDIELMKYSLTIQVFIMQIQITLFLSEGGNRRHASNVLLSVGFNVLVVCINRGISFLNF